MPFVKCSSKCSDLDLVLDLALEVVRHWWRVGLGFDVDVVITCIFLTIEAQEHRDICQRMDARCLSQETRIGKSNDITKVFNQKCHRRIQNWQAVSRFFTCLGVAVLAQERLAMCRRMALRCQNRQTRNGRSNDVTRVFNQQCRSRIRNWRDISRCELGRATCQSCKKGPGAGTPYHTLPMHHTPSATAATTAENDTSTTNHSQTSCSTSHSKSSSTSTTSSHDHNSTATKPHSSSRNSQAQTPWPRTQEAL
ncbi:uncharacterized protein Dana_GF10383 [Drosophila ananassae]|uniref:Uncharacterized protein n=1 Tax=Drosophila ananassae TaxID=7217 RepID=B3MAB6_DROAN|nr:uncharacterized protein Dana_GF10383 [Drosophila ananassae]